MIESHPCIIISFLITLLLSWPYLIFIFKNQCCKCYESGRNFSGSGLAKTDPSASKIRMRIRNTAKTIVIVYVQVCGWCTHLLAVYVEGRR